MPPNDAPSDLADRVAALNAHYRHHAASDILQHALHDPRCGRLAMVSSFGAESVVLLHLIALNAPMTPVLFIDTQLMFTETLVYQHELSERLGLRDLRIVRAEAQDLEAADPDARLHARDVDACCNLRKTAPLLRALEGFDGWITGRKRFQNTNRAALDFFEVEDGTDRIKVNPLAHWTSEDLQTYMTENRLPKHPLVAQGYASIGCMPCTSKTAPGEDPRAGRWRGHAKSECGIHFKDGKIVRKGVLI